MVFNQECPVVLTGFESDGNTRERRSRSFLYNRNVVPVVFFLYTVTVIFHVSPSVIQLIRLLPAFMHVNDNVYDIMNDTFAM